jgi:hypothetical protein
MCIRLSTIFEREPNLLTHPDPADALRFYALRLRDASLVKSSPDEIIAKGTDWRFLNQLKQELPAPTADAQNSSLLCHLGQGG